MDEGNHERKADRQEGSQEATQITWEIMEAAVFGGMVICGY